MAESSRFEIGGPLRRSPCRHQNFDCPWAGEWRAGSRPRQPGGPEPFAEVVFDAPGAVAILREEIVDAGLARDPHGGCRVARRESAAAQQAHDPGRLLPGRSNAGRVPDQHPDRRVVGEQLERVFGPASRALIARLS
jgi:hypothetical protein